MTRCTHHYILPSSDSGLPMIGVCKFCGHEKTFNPRWSHGEAYGRKYQKDGAHKWGRMAIAPRTVCVER